jgi:uncharacterized short protein YbdD (DUF466 family)
MDKNKKKEEKVVEAEVSCNDYSDYLKAKKEKKPKK